MGLRHAIEISAPLGGRLAVPEWIVPLEFVFYCAPPRLQADLRARISAGERFKPDAKVFRVGAAFRAIIELDTEAYRATLLPVDVWTLEPTVGGEP